MLDQAYAQEETWKKSLGNFNIFSIKHDVIIKAPSETQKS